MSNKIVITAHNISQKQWSTLLLELNLIKKAWRPVGVKLDLQAKNLKKIIHWVTKKYDEP